jgi:hypothetical protein
MRLTGGSPNGETHARDHMHAHRARLRPVMSAASIRSFAR